MGLRSFGHGSQKQYKGCMAVASGHLGGFSDPLMDCKECKTRHRADNLIEDFDGTNVAGWSNEKMTEYIKEKLAALLNTNF